MDSTPEDDEFSPKDYKSGYKPVWCQSNFNAMNNSTAAPPNSTKGKISFCTIFIAVVEKDDGLRRAFRDRSDGPAGTAPAQLLARE